MLLDIRVPAERIASARVVRAYPTSKPGAVAVNEDGTAPGPSGV